MDPIVRELTMLAALACLVSASRGVEANFALARSGRQCTNSHDGRQARQQASSHDASSQFMAFRSLPPTGLYPELSFVAHYLDCLKIESPAEAGLNSECGSQS